MNMNQSITIGEKTFAFGPAGSPASTEEGLRLVQDFLRIQREDLRKEILAFVTERLIVQREEDYGRANASARILVADAGSSVRVALNSATTWNSFQGQLTIAKAEIAKLKKLVSDFKLPDAGTHIP